MLKIDFLIVRNRCRAEEGNVRDINLVKTFLTRGLSCGMVTSCQRIHAQLKKEGIFSVQLFEEIKVPSRIENIEERAARIETEYNIPSLKNFVFTEKCYYGEDENYLIRKAIVYCEWLEKFFDRVEVKCLINTQGGQIDIRAVYHIAKKRGLTLIYPGDSIFPNKIPFFSDEMNNLDGFKDIAWGEMTKEQREEIEDYLRQFRELKRVYLPSLLFSKKDEIVRSFIALQEYLRNKKFKTLKIVLEAKLKNFFANPVNKIFSSFIYQRDLKNEKFIYFPLHASDDTQITIRNPQFYDQSWLVLYIARILPFGCKLYIKEHPGNLFSVGDKKKFRKEKNISFLRPNLNSHEIIKKAKAIITINSTVGLEALHYFKPVIVLGNWIFGGRGVTIDVQDLSKLDRIIKHVLENPSEIDPNKVKAFLFSLKESMFDGSDVAPIMNYDEMVDSIVKKYQEFKK